MLVTVNGLHGGRQYVVDTNKREIVRKIGQGRPPSPDMEREIIRVAMNQVGSKPAAFPEVSLMPTPSMPRRSSPSRIAPDVAPEPAADISDDEILNVLRDRMTMFRDIVEGVCYGEFYSAVISGGPGMGKSHLTNEILDAAEEERDLKYLIIQGGQITPVKLYDVLYEYRERNNVVVLDDSDTILGDELGMMILKAALDSKPERKLSWRSQGSKEAPDEFSYRGAMIFLTNQNFHAQIDRGVNNPTNKRIQHLQAITSRVTYLDLMMNTTRARYLWTREVLTKEKVLDKHELSKREQQDILTFLHDNMNNFREMSIRTVVVNVVPYVKMQRRHPEKDWRRAVATIAFKSQLPF